MAFNKISLNKVDAQAVSTFNVPLLTDTEASGTDIMYHLGTGLGTTTFTNPANTSNLTVTSTGTFSGSVDDLTNRVNAIGWRFNIGATATYQFLNNYTIDINAYTIKSSGSDRPTTWILEVSNDGTNWTTIHRVDNFSFAGNFSWSPFRCPNRQGFFSYARFTFIANTTSTGSLDEIGFYGRIQNLTTGVAGYINYTGTFESFQETDVINLKDNRVIKYDGVNWEATPRFPWEVHKLNLTGNHTITSAYIPKYYIVSPGGAPRTITLPSSPNQDDAIKIKNVDGANALTIEETPGDPTPVILSNAGKLQYEFVWDGTSWIVTG